MSLLELELATELEKSEGLPEGWVQSTIGDTFDINPPKPSLNVLDASEPVSFVPMPAVDAIQGAITGAYDRPYGDCRSGFTSFAENDVIMAKITPCMENGKAAIARGLTNGLAAGSTEFHVMRPTGAALPEYLFYYIRQQNFRSQAESEMTGSVGQKRVPADFIRNAEFPLPPLAEQQRIVAAIEALTARIDAARASLDRATTILKHFRQSVLAAACSGRLTADWREENLTAETGQELLQRIVLKRRAQWITDGRRGMYIEPQTPDASELPELPEDWCWARLQTLIAHGPQNGIYLPQSAYGSGHPIIRIDDYQNNISKPSEKLRKVRASNQEIVTYGLNTGDFLINRVNSPSHLGKSLLLREINLPAIFESNMMRFRPSEHINGEYLELYLHSFKGREALIKDAKWAVNQASINQRDVENTAIPLPPLIEQRTIVKQTNEALHLANTVENRVNQAIRLTVELIQSSIAKAFRGELVPTEAELARQEGRGYESAAELLARVRAEREASGVVKGTRRRKTGL